MATNEPGYKAPDVTMVGENHLKVYLETNGATGYLWNGVPILVLTTKGRKSGQARKIPIIFTTDGPNFVLIASKGGAPAHPAWYENLLADPTAEVQVKDRKYPVRARTATGEERERLWKASAKVWPNYDVYVTRTTRAIPVVVLEPRG